jgi:hypothetical protein
MTGDDECAEYHLRLAEAQAISCIERCATMLDAVCSLLLFGWYSASARHGDAPSVRSTT